MGRSVSKTKIIFLTLLVISTTIYFKDKWSYSPYPQGTKMLIFDFDGTIADSLPAIFQALNNNASYFGYKTIERIELLAGKDSSEFLKEFEISSIKLPFVVQAVRNEVNKKITSIQPFDQLKSILDQLKAKQVKLGIVTSNSTQNVKEFLAYHNLDYFDLIHGGSSLFGKGKILKKLLNDHNLEASNVIYIGDETRDIQAAQENHIRCAAVTWGLCTAERLAAYKPDFIVHDKSDLLMLAQII
ncbi:HAD-IA family hydrolase [Candidatus Dependentiae bacterium]|nr:HAD-IA family hydrolase [Candidatus Dependentiae bacterium]